MRPHDTADEPIRIPLYSKKYPGLFALVDRQDYERVSAHRWTVEATAWTKYANARIDGKTVRMHRFITDCPKGLEVDHVNHEGLDNRRANLRICTSQQNNWNHAPGSRRGASGYWGVEARWYRFRAYIQIGGKLIRLGNFDTAEEAARVRDVAAKEHFGEFATLNFPDDTEAA